MSALAAFPVRMRYPVCPVHLALMIPQCSTVIRQSLAPTDQQSRQTAVMAMPLTQGRQMRGRPSAQRQTDEATTARQDRLEMLLLVAMTLLPRLHEERLFRRLRQGTHQNLRPMGRPMLEAIVPERPQKIRSPAVSGGLRPASPRAARCRPRSLVPPQQARRDPPRRDRYQL